MTFSHHPPLASRSGMGSAPWGHYTREYGWDATFAALVTRVVAEYVETDDPARRLAALLGPSSATTSRGGTTRSRPVHP